jgi:pimeloyl-ACP methyl ester carboxylesterase
VLLVDLRGHGDSQPPILLPYEGDRYTFDALGREILEVLDHEEVASAHFVGISLGCILIRTIGEIAPERVRSMVMGGAIIRLDLRSRFLVTLGNAFKRIVPYMWLYRLFAWIIMPRKRHREARNLFVTQAKRLCQKEFIRWFRLTYEVNPLLRRLFEQKELPIPTLYVMGDEDHMFLPSVSGLVSRHTRFSRLEVLPECGHVVNVDRPELFNVLSMDFIRSAAPSPA